MKRRSLPKTIYASVNNEGTVNEFISADVSQAAEIEGDGPTLVGTYQLVESNLLTKKVVTEIVKKKL